MSLLAIIDTETTSLDPQEGHLLEVGIVRWSVAFGRVVDSLSLLVKGADSNPAEDVNGIPAGLAHMFGLSPAHVAEVLHSHLLPCDAILGHSVAFDAAWIAAHLSPLPADKPLLCTRNDFDWEHGKPGDSLVSIALAHGVPVVSAHRALSDCMLIAGVLETYLKKSGKEADTIDRMLARAARPRCLLQSRHEFKDNEAAKALGFRWEAGSKRWLKRHAKEDPPPAAGWPIVEVPS